MAQNNVSEIKKLKKDMKLLNSKLNNVLKENEALHNMIENQTKNMNEALELIGHLIEMTKKQQIIIDVCQNSIIDLIRDQSLLFKISLCLAKKQKEIKPVNFYVIDKKQ